MDKAGDRAADVERAFSFFQVGIADPDDLSILRGIAPGVPDDELRRAVTYLPSPATRRPTGSGHSTRRSASPTSRSP